MRFIYEGTQLPPFLAQYVGFFTGLVIGALGGFALHSYIQHNKYEKAKIKLVIHHILRVIQDDYSYYAMLQDPPKLLLCIETEVMRLVDKHLTQKEATQATKALKHSFSKVSNISLDEVVHKRVREDYRDVIKERRESAFATVQQKQHRGFLDPPESEIPCHGYVHGLWSTSKAICQSPFKTAGRHDSLLEEPDEDLGLGEDLMVIDKVTPSFSEMPSVPGYLFGGYSRRTARLHNSSSARQSIFRGGADTSTPQLDKGKDSYESLADSIKLPEPARVMGQVAGGLQGVHGPLHAPEAGSFGLDYEDPNLYSDRKRNSSAQTPSCRPSASTTRKPTRFRKGRRYGLSRPFHIEQAEQAEPETLQKMVTKAAAKSPATATRKSSRIEKQKKKKKQDE